MRRPTAAANVTKHPPQRGPRALFPVAGVGVSAGGLFAAIALLRQLGAQPDIAVVIAHRLDPIQAGELVSILTEAARLPVHAVSDGMRIESNHVYVIPPGADLGILDGALRLTLRGEGDDRAWPIDRCFEALAQAFTVHAVGVVLLGTGADGASGIAAIKAEGGVTFAQAAGAESRSAPQGASAAGCVDFVLPPEDIARELLRISEHAPAGWTADDNIAFHRILAALHAVSGIDFAHYQQPVLRRRVQRRAVVNAIPGLREYADRVEGNFEEARALCDEALSSVTSFFREPEVFAALNIAVLPRLIEHRRPDAGIRVWVPGCSTGEEAYSVAIDLLEFLAAADAGGIPVKLFATDASAAALDRARAGKYPLSIARTVSAERLARYFLKLEGGYQICKEVRDLCIFAKQDATRDPPFAGLDLIVCRNLVRSLGPALQERVLPIFHYALKESGFLVLGTAETVRSLAGFSALRATGGIYVRSPVVLPQALDLPDLRLADLAPHEVIARAKQLGLREVQRAADRLVLAKLAPSGVVVNEELTIVQFRGRTGSFLDLPTGTASFELLRMAREELRLPLRQTINDARTRGIAVRRAGLSVSAGAELRRIELEVTPFRVASTAQQFFLVLFHDAAPAAPTVAAPVPAGALSEAESQLAQELGSMRDCLQSVIKQLEARNEELKAANEEIAASNEEFRSANEALQRAKEELQASNEELCTVNDEMTVRNRETTRLNDDLTNVLNSVDIPIIILGPDARVRRFTKAAGKLFVLHASDLGRPLSDIRSRIPASELKAMITKARRRLGPVVRTVKDEDGRWHQLTVRPYRTLDDRIDGTVITAFDIDALKKGAQLLSEAQKYAESIIDTIRECLLVLDGELRVRSANRAFYQTFGVTSKELEGRQLEDLGRGEWRIPELLQRLDELREGDRFAEYRVEREYERAGRRVFVLNARRIEKTPLILLAFEDVTEKEVAEQARRHTDKLQDMAFDTALVEERERRRIAVDLHDRIGQSLALAQIKLTAMREPLSGASRAAVDQAIELLAQSITDTRTLSFELSPPILYELGIKEAISWLAEELGERHGLRIALTDDDQDKPLADAPAALLFRAVRELLMNVIKHAKTPCASVSLRRIGKHFDIEIADQGVGFDPSASAFPSSHGGYGLFSVREQLGRLGGRVEVASEPGQGTRVHIRIPLNIDEVSQSDAKKESL